VGRDHARRDAHSPGLLSRPALFSWRPRSKRSRPADEVEPTAGYYKEDTSSLRAGDAWRLGPGLWAPKRAGNGAQTNPGPEGILAKGKAGAPIRTPASAWCESTRVRPKGGRVLLYNAAGYSVASNLAASPSD
jgi:hypothetical protein